MQIRNLIREVLYKMGLIQGMKDKFQDKRIPDCQDFYDSYIAKWKAAYSVDKQEKSGLRRIRRQLALGSYGSHA